jgi:hypothetical protein
MVWILEQTSRFKSSLDLNWYLFLKRIQMLKEKLFDYMVLDTMTFTIVYPFFQFETFLRGLLLESMKWVEIAALQMVDFPADQLVTMLVYVPSP